MHPVKPIDQFSCAHVCCVVDYLWFNMDVSERDIVEHNCFDFDLKSEQIEIVRNVLMA